MEMLLDVIHDLVDVPGRIAGMQTAAGSRFDYCLVVPRADGRFHVSTKQRNDAILIRPGYAARCLAPLTLDRARLTSRDPPLHEEVIAAEESTTESTHAPANRARYAATRRTVEFEWNGEHLSALLQEQSPESGGRHLMHPAAGYQRGA